MNERPSNRRSLLVLSRWALLLFLAVGLAEIPSARADELKLGVFSVDVTPPLGSPLCDSLCPPASEIVDPLSARGIVLLSKEAPVVLCAVDWVGIGNDGHRAWRESIAAAVETTADRVAVHCLHQHDAPGCDFSTEKLLAEHGLAGAEFDVSFALRAIESVALAARLAKDQARTVNGLAFGLGRVDRVASNRRILGPDGKVKIVRFSSSKDAEAIAAPEGTIDPLVRLVAFYHDDEPLASLTYYATHPQSYYGQGGVSADFVGAARAIRERESPGPAHIHFCGAGGNVAAGKYNDGAPERRAELAGRLAAGMKEAWDTSTRVSIGAGDVGWFTESVVLPASPGIDVPTLTRQLDDANLKTSERVRAARDLTWLARAKAGGAVDLSLLKLGPVMLLHMPGELFVEYQLHAQRSRPRFAVCMAAYGDYGMGYIGTQIAYEQGGYETTRVSRVAPEVEPILTQALDKLLDQADPPVR